MNVQQGRVIAVWMRIVQTPSVHLLANALRDFTELDSLAQVCCYHYHLRKVGEKRNSTSFFSLTACSCGTGSSGPSCSSGGICTCFVGWTGSKCDQCASNFFGSACQGLTEKSKRKEKKKQQGKNWFFFSQLALLVWMELVIQDWVEMDRAAAILDGLWEQPREFVTLVLLGNMDHLAVVCLSLFCKRKEKRKNRGKSLIPFIDRNLPKLQ